MKACAVHGARLDKRRHCPGSKNGVGWVSEQTYEEQSLYAGFCVGSGGLRLPEHESGRCQWRQPGLEQHQPTCRHQAAVASALAQHDE
jgi:hypothetical protein